MTTDTLQHILERLATIDEKLHALRNDVSEIKRRVNGNESRMWALVIGVGMALGAAVLNLMSRVL